MCVLILVYMCPHTTIYVSSYCYICVLILHVSEPVLVKKKQIADSEGAQWTGAWLHAAAADTSRLANALCCDDVGAASVGHAVLYPAEENNLSTSSGHGAGGGVCVCVCVCVFVEEVMQHRYYYIL